MVVYRVYSSVCMHTVPYGTMGMVPYHTYCSTPYTSYMGYMGLGGLSLPMVPWVLGVQAIWGRWGCTIPYGTSACST